MGERLDKLGGVTCTEKPRMQILQIPKKSGNHE